jgi:hypothetical protein
MLDLDAAIHHAEQPGSGSDLPRLILGNAQLLPKTPHAPRSSDAQGLCAMGKTSSLRRNTFTISKASSISSKRA